MSEILRGRAWYAGSYTRVRPSNSIMWWGWSTPGPGRWWVEDQCFFMHRFLHPFPMRLSAAEVTHIEPHRGSGVIGRATGPYIRFHWHNRGTDLFSSFALNWNPSQKTVNNSAHLKETDGKYRPLAEILADEILG